MIDYKRQLTEQELQDGEHRDFIGGLWDEVGDLQFRFVVDQGLARGTNFLDIGCGCLRGGVRFIQYLDAGRYYGMDINESLLEAGYEQELLQCDLQKKMPRKNLIADPEFDFSRFGVQFGAAVAQSVFTHLPMNHIQLCLIELAKVLEPGGRLFATIFECPDEHPPEQPLVHKPGGVISSLARDPYHYRLADIRLLADASCWNVEYIGDWQHPRDQKMLCLIRK